MASSGSSFIPQRPTKGKVAAKSFRKVYILSYVSYIIFFTTLIAAAGVFFYDVSLKSQLNGLKQDLVAQKNLFNQSDLDRVRNLNNRVDTAKQLLDNHASLLRVFTAFDSVVADPVQFLSFSYDRKEDFRRPRLLMSAVAEEFDEVIFQDRTLATNSITDEFEVINVNLTTQPIDEEQLQLGVQQVVNVSMTADLNLPEINFLGRTLPGPSGPSENNGPSPTAEAPADSPADESEPVDEPTEPSASEESDEPVDQGSDGQQ